MSTKRTGTPGRRSVATTALVRVFVSYNRTDQRDVESIARKLDATDIDVWFDRWNLVPGEPWQSAVEKALGTCHACTVFVGRLGTGPWQHEEMRSAINRRVTSPGFRVIPAFLPGAPAEPVGLSDFLLAGHSVRFESLDDRAAIRLLIAGVRGIAPGPSSRRMSPRIVYEVVITGSFREADRNKIEVMFEHLRKLSQDADLTLKAVRSGSLVLLVEGQESGFNRLKDLMARGELVLPGTSILEVRRYREDQLVDHTDRASVPAALNRARVLLVDSDLRVLAATKQVLGEQFDVVAALDNVNAVTGSAANLKPDVVVLGVAPVGNGLDTVRALGRIAPQTRIVFFTTEEAPAVIADALRAGATGYVLKTSHPSELVLAVRQAVKQQSYMTAALVPRLLANVGDSEGLTRSVLTAREREILRLVAQGRTSKEVADRLSLTRRTVDSHRASIAGKLGLTRLTDLFKFASRRRLVDREEEG